MRSRKWIKARAEINELVGEAREIERMISDGSGRISYPALVEIMGHLNRFSGRF
jgi:hypothetical protein